jgi:hypothetical protein
MQRRNEMRVLTYRIPEAWEGRTVESFLRQAHGFSQGAGRDPHHARLLQFRKLAIIAGQATDHSIGYIFFLQEAPSLRK